MPRRAASPLCTVKRTRIAPAISIAVPQASPSPCAKCASPTENSAPSTKTGSMSRAPLLSCLMSRLPPFSRGGIVRSACEAIGSVAGTAAQILCRGSLADLAVESITRLDLDLLARRRLDDRRDRFVPAIVALARLLGEALGVVDRDALHDLPPIHPLQPRLCVWPVRS